MSQSRRSAQQMYPLVESYLQGESTQKAFCARHDLSPFVLNYWLRKYRQEQLADPLSAAEFVEVQPSLPIWTASRSYDRFENAFAEMYFTGGVRLRFFAAVSPDYLRGLLR